MTLTASVTTSAATPISRQRRTAGKLPPDRDLLGVGEGLDGLGQVGGGVEAAISQAAGLADVQIGQLGQQGVHGGKGIGRVGEGQTAQALTASAGIRLWGATRTPTVSPARAG